MHDADVIIRPERPYDSGGIRYALEEAFGRKDEADIVHRLRNTPGFVPELSVVADSGGFIIGHAIFTEVTVYSLGTSWTALALGPIGVMPDHQGMGIGGRLIRAGLEKSRELGYPLVALIGHPEYYPRFGFGPASQLGLTCNIPVPDEVFMAISLNREKIHPGNLVYPKAFFC